MNADDAAGERRQPWRDSARDAQDSRWAKASARIGLGSRALIYGLFAVLIVVIVVGGSSPTGNDTDQSSSLQVLGRNPAGDVVLVVLAIAVVCYSLWRFSESWLGTADPGHSRSARVQAAIEGVAYLPFGYAALSVVFGADRNARQGRHYQALSASVFTNVLGQIAVAVVGAVVVGVGAFFVIEGARRTFLSHFDFDDMRPWAVSATRWAGTVGSFGRGLMFALAGILLIYAAATTEPAKAGGIDSALDILARQPYGMVLLLLAATGFASFALFAVCEATWRRV